MIKRLLTTGKVNLVDFTIAVYIICAITTDEGSRAMKLARLFLLGVFVLCITFELCIRKKAGFKINPYMIWLAMFWAFATLSVFWAQSRSFASAMSVTLLTNLVCICILLHLIDGQKRRMDIAANSMIIAPLILEARVILSHGLLAFLDTRSAGGISGNVVGVCAAYGACFAVYYWMQRGHRPWYALLFTLNAITLVLSASRKAILCVGIPLAILYILDRKANFKIRVRKILFLALAGIIGLIAVMKIPFLYQLIGYRIEGTIAVLVGNIEAVDASSESRSILITRGMEWFREKPVIGYGIDNYRVVLVQHHPNWPIEYYAHNNYVELLVDVGIIGFALYYWIYASMLLKALRSRRKLQNPDVLIVGMLLSLLVVEYAMVTYFDKFVQIFLMLLWLHIRSFGRIAAMDATNMEGKSYGKYEKFAENSPQTTGNGDLSVAP